MGRCARLPWLCSVAAVVFFSGCHLIAPFISFAVDGGAGSLADGGVFEGGMDSAADGFDGSSDASTDDVLPDSAGVDALESDVVAPDLGAGPTAQSTVVATFAGNEPGNPFCHPMAVASDTAGVAFVADTFNNVVRKVDSEQISLVAGTSRNFCVTADNSCVGDFCRPGGIAVNSSGNIYVGDCFNNRIRKIDGGLVTTIAGGVAGFADGNATSARFNLFDNLSGVCGVAVTDGDVVLVADPMNHSIRRIANGVVDTLAGTGTAGHQDGPALSASFQRPTGVAVNANGGVYVADRGNNCIRMIEAGQVTTLAGDPNSAPTFDDGPVAQARFNRPSGVAVDAAGRVFVADSMNHRIRMISGGQVTTIAGTGATGLRDSTGDKATFYTPTDLALGASNGTLIVTDRHNHVIRMVTW